MSDILKRLGINPSMLQDHSCKASEEVHVICDFLLAQIKDAEEDFKAAMVEADLITAHEVRVVCETMYQIAVALHDGEHLKDIDDE